MATRIVHRRSLRSWVVATSAALCALHAPAAILKGPYVLLEEATKLSIRVELDRPEATVVLRHGAGGESRLRPEFFRSPRDTFLARVAVDLGEFRGFRGYDLWHGGRLVGRYDWRSRLDGPFDDHPRLLVFGDTQGGKEIVTRLAGQWRKEAFDLAVGLGDLVDAGSRYESWDEEFFGPLRDFLPHHPLLVVPGNHDAYRERSMAWFDWFFGRADGRRHFAIDFRDLRLIGLNNADVHTKYGIDPLDALTSQYDFLRDALLARDAVNRQAVVFAHVPLFSASTVVNREFGSELQRRYVQPLFARARVPAFFAGHHHKYERLVRPGLRGETRHFVSGGGGGRLFAPDRDSAGGWKMDRQIFGLHHYLIVDFRGAGSVVARSIDGEVIDRAELGAAAPAVADGGRLAIWPATLAADFSTPATSPAVDAIRLDPPAAPPVPGRPTAGFYRTTAGFVAVARDLRASGEEDGVFTLQGYDPARRFWGFLQGAIMTMRADGLRGSLAIVAVGGAELSPLDRIFPVLHWPVATARAGVTEQSVLWLRGEGSFDLDARPKRVLGRWRWGPLPRADVAAAQAARQWSVLDGAPAPAAIPGDAANGLLQMVRERDLRCFVVRREDGGSVVATLVHWPEHRLLAIAPGATLAAGRDAIFVPVDRATEVAVGSEAGLAGLRLRAPGRPELFVPLGSSATDAAP